MNLNETVIDNWRRSSSIYETPDGRIIMTFSCHHHVEVPLASLVHFRHDRERREYLRSLYCTLCAKHQLMFLFDAYLR